MKVLIIDDEVLAREALKIQIRKFADYSILEAGDGEEGLAILKKENPDVAFIDIQMPGMSGIDFMEEGRKICSQTFFIVLSGYNFFAYAQKAIEYNACKYLLKPVSDQAVEELFKEIELKLSVRERQKNKYKEIYLTEQKQKRSLKRKYIYELLNVKKSRRESLVKRIEELGSCFDKPFFQIFLIRIGNILPNEEELLKFGIWNIAGEIFTGEEQCIELFDDISGAGILLNTINPPYENEFQKNINAMFAETNKFCRFIGVNQVTFGIGERVQGIESLDAVYDSAKQTLNLYLAGGEHKLYFAGGDTLKCKYNTSNKQNWEKRFTKALLTENKEAVIECIDDFYAQYTEGDFISIKELHKLHLSFFVLLQKAVQSYETRDRLEDEFYLYNKIQKLDSIEEMHQFLLEKVRACFQIIDTQRISGNKKIVQRGKQFIEENLGNDLTLNAVAEYAGVSAVYFSKIFKEEEGKNFIDYVTKRRMEIACDLLEGNMKTAEISERIGYHDMKHFYKVFKKYMGISPSQYRKKIR